VSFFEYLNAELNLMGKTKHIARKRQLFKNLEQVKLPCNTSQHWSVMGGQQGR